MNNRLTVYKQIYGVKKFGTQHEGRLYTFLQDPEGTMMKNSWHLLDSSVKLEDIAKYEERVAGENAKFPGSIYGAYFMKTDDSMVQGTYKLIKDVNEEQQQH